MSEILLQLGILTITMICNMLCGLYYNVNVQKIRFDKYKLLNGMIKAFIVGIIVVCMTVVFQQKPQLAEVVGATPDLIINSAIVLYASKALVGLSKILGVKIETK